eukprot:gnl/TRDRNA2_/TRDRNA2_150775_c0_seq2.p1 gnl/TRDRNA2_/TRDRNA2_150775_c0~~gnl/TRDRNA2_/TRDRNA2_150775_c0_seq2.p1  ORF type:complete len:456 (-),score=85.06 gnl/TRDRNA2_/TRDRNA2_150775_c0_seq2:6-1301(-)
MRAAAAPLWLVADMDKTLIDKPPPATKNSPALSQSPTYGPVMSWLRRGGRLCVVTTDDGYRPFRKLWNEIPKELRAERRVVMASSDGAALFYGDEEGNLAEDMAYSNSADDRTGCLRFGHSLRLPPDGDDMDKLLNICRSLYIRFLEELAADRLLLSQLEGRVHAGYAKILDKLDEIEKTQAAGVHDDAARQRRRRDILAEILSPEALTRPGAVLPVGTMIWRNQAGPLENWVREGGETDPYFGYYSSEGGRSTYTNLFMMGLPQQVSLQYIGQSEFVQGLAALGLEASAAPNSVCIRSKRVSKDLAVRWMEARPEYAFQFSQAVAFGDNPLGNDGPLAALPLPFVSVAPELPTGQDRPPAWQEGGFFHVGGCEKGTALVLELLLRALEEAGDNASAGLARLPEICTVAAERVAMAGRTSATDPSIATSSL